MSVDGVQILESDFASDVYNDFFERYNEHQQPSAIAAALRGEYASEILGAADNEIFATALAQCLWSVGESTAELIPELQALVASDATSEFWGDLYPSRIAALKRFIRKISTPRKRPVQPKRLRVSKRLPFDEGDYLAFTKRNGKRVPVVVWSIERRGPLAYGFVFPNLSRTNDRNAITQLLQTESTIPDEILAVFFNARRRFPVTTINHSDIKHHLDRFHRFGNRPIGYPRWQGSSFGYCGSFEDFERTVNERGSRAFSDWELELIAC